MAVQKYVAIMTSYGKSVAINAYNSGDKVQIKYMGIGDGNGEEYTPHPEQEDLRNEWAEIEVHDVFVDPKNPAWLITEGLVPESIGGKWIREISLKDDKRNVITISSWPATYKPLFSEGGSTAAVIRVAIEISDIDVFDLNIDTSLALVTRDEHSRHLQNIKDAHGGPYLPSSGGKIDPGATVTFPITLSPPDVTDGGTTIDAEGIKIERCSGPSVNRVAIEANGVTVGAGAGQRSHATTQSSMGFELNTISGTSAKLRIIAVGGSGQGSHLASLVLQAYNNETKSWTDLSTIASGALP